MIGLKFGDPGHAACIVACTQLDRRAPRAAQIGAGSFHLGRLVRERPGRAAPPSGRGQNVPAASPGPVPALSQQNFLFKSIFKYVDSAVRRRPRSSPKEISLGAPGPFDLRSPARPRGIRHGEARSSALSRKRSKSGDRFWV